MNLFNSNSHIIVCLDPKGEILPKKSLFPENTNLYEVTDLVELLRKNECISTYETNNVYVQIDLANDKVEITHTLRNENGSLDYETMSYENSCFDKEHFLVTT